MINGGQQVSREMLGMVLVVIAIMILILGGIDLFWFPHNIGRSFIPEQSEFHIILVITSAGVIGTIGAHLLLRGKRDAE